jgi:hypothetical protein
MEKILILQIALVVNYLSRAITSEYIEVHHVECAETSLFREMQIIVNDFFLG